MHIEHEVNSDEMLFRYAKWNKWERPFHWHEKAEIVQCIEGSFEALIDGVNYNVKKGDILVISERIIHKFNVSEDNLIVRLVQLSYKVILNHNPVPVHVKAYISSEEISRNKDLKDNIESLFAIMSTMESPVNGTKDRYAECIFSGLYFLLGKYFPVAHYTKSMKKEKQDFYDTVKYVNEHFREDITVQSIAKALYTDRGRLSRIFLKYAGVSLNDYINSMRLNEALKLIDAGSKITDAALESGFQTVRTFSNFYKKHIKN